MYGLWRALHDSMHPTGQQGIFQTSGTSVVVWCVCSWFGTPDTFRDDYDR